MFGSIIGSIAGAAVSGMLSNKGAKDAGQANAALQREFAQNGIRWKVEDAKVAGIHPLYAIGAPTVSASPSYVAPGVPDLTTVGQDIGRAIDAKRTQPERTSARLEALSLERAQLENDLLRSQIARVNQAGSPPPLPSGGSFIDGQSNVLIDTVPLSRTASSPGNPHSEPGAIPDTGYAVTPQGALAPVPSSDVKQRIEDNFLPQTMWSLRNLITPNFGGGKPPPLSALPEGFDTWDWSASNQGWVPGRKSRGYLNYSDLPSVVRSWRRGDTSGFNWRR